jgi:hippurate hydrolase
MNKALAAALAMVLGVGISVRADVVHAEFRPAQREAVAKWVGEHLDGLVDVCKHIHATPELSRCEEKTAALAAEHLRKYGYDVTTDVGGHGVVGVLRNGTGPTVLVRGDMDALPITEDTGLDYASQVRVTLPDGTTTGVMHACGHDVHTTTLLGTAGVLSAARDQWRGTVVMVAQPAEESGGGAERMIQDGLFERFPRPDFCLSLHVSHEMPAGQVGYHSGWAAANVDAVDITIYGRGGHGAKPSATVDPIVTAAYVITQLQTLVSRRVDPVKPAVVTVGAIHGGSRHNVIPDEVTMKLTVRSYQQDVRRQLLDGIRQITTDVCTSFGCPRPPKVDIREGLPACYNDPDLTAAAVDVFRKVFGADNVIERPAGMGGEDFGMFPRHLEKPGLQISLGSVARERYEASLQPGAEPLPSLHSSKYVADLRPSLQTGVTAMSTLTLSLLDTGK